MPVSGEGERDGAESVLAGGAEEVAAPVMVENFLRESLVDGLVRSVIE